MWVKLQVEDKNCVFCEYGPRTEKEDEVKNIFMEGLTDCFGRFTPSEWISFLEERNRKVEEGKE